MIFFEENMISWLLMDNALTSAGIAKVMMKRQHRLRSVFLVNFNDLLDFVIASHENS